ncbi:hypothetical protein CDO52_09455 [Nocardiopsis gilva YIM 90087]|uniref:Uncharacterized protein n=1 Tax=Nocardiopsis gilva YIM 90087 TaxID=1235441 RepID=A0A223S4C1_9ACTN|nr:hypothetical protein [Nocardiopsis gilva]ASU82986.1 hypothetical protein CDO52_09455 [Nocardiopsis gilva YIM 90087]
MPPLCAPAVARFFSDALEAGEGAVVLIRPIALAKNGDQRRLADPSSVVASTAPWRSTLQGA